MFDAVASAPAALPPLLRAPALVLVILGVLVVFVLAVVFAGETSVGGVDAAILPAIDGVTPPLRYAALVFDFGGEPLGSPLLVAAVAGMCLWRRRMRLAVVTIAGVVVTVGVTSVLKPVVGRMIHGHYLSFPSGHTAFATALAVVVALLFAERLSRVAAVSLLLGLGLIAALLMGWAQVALGAHYPTDALGGFFAALAVMLAVAWCVDRLLPRRHAG
ncbi:phosphatase PAP2 family protein [Amycolatopsis sp. NPDC059027]|uniref:phosphatase PAP2 family protein n=1 Tax=Amycolatopsis sp. NPDC059027 TaxID=3346709 RepID=UPI00366AFBCD